MVELQIFDLDRLSGTATSLAPDETVDWGLNLILPSNETLPFIRQSSPCRRLIGATIPNLIRYVVPNNFRLEGEVQG